MTVEQTQHAMVPSNKDEFLNMVRDKIEEVRADGTVSQVFLLCVHEPTEEHEDGGASFIHNLPDNMLAAHVCNNICAHIFFHEQDKAANAVKN